LAQIDAVGVPVLTQRFDIANARLRFESGLIANLTASRISAQKLRKFRIWSANTYFSLDFAAREAEVYRLVAGAGEWPEIEHERVSAPEQEPLRRQLAGFVEASCSGTAPVVSGEAGRRALALAHQILARMA
jgi:predicted dehydrogenase